MVDHNDEDFMRVRDALKGGLIHRIPPSAMFLVFILIYGTGLFFLHSLLAEGLREMVLASGSDDATATSSRAIQVFMTLVGLMFAILVGQATTLSLNRLSNVQNSINELAASMGSMLATAHALGDDIQMKIARTLGRYIDIILDFDVESFAKLSERESRMGDYIVRTIREGATDGVHDDFDNAAAEAFMRFLHDWTRSRISWQTAVMNKLNPLRLLNLEFLSLIALLLMMMVSIGSLVLEGLLFALTGAAMRMVLLLVLLTDSYGHSTRISSIVNLNYGVLMDVQKRAEWILNRYAENEE